VKKLGSSCIVKAWDVIDNEVSKGTKIPLSLRERARERGI